MTKRSIYPLEVRERTVRLILVNGHLDSRGQGMSSFPHPSALICLREICSSTTLLILLR